MAGWEMGYGDKSPHYEPGDLISKCLPYPESRIS